MASPKTHTWMRSDPGAGDPLPLRGLIPRLSGVSDQSHPYKSPLQQDPWILPPVHSWNPPTALHHHGNHRVPGTDSPRTGTHGGPPRRSPCCYSARPPPPPTHKKFSALQLNATYKMLVDQNAPLPQPSMTPTRITSSSPWLTSPSARPVSPLPLLLGTLAPQKCCGLSHSSRSSCLCGCSKPWWQFVPCRNLSVSPGLEANRTSWLGDLRQVTQPLCYPHL